MTDNRQAVRLGPFSISLMIATLGAASRRFTGHHLVGLVFPIAAVAFAATARGAIITQYSFTDVVAGTLNLNATTEDPNVTAGSITGSPSVNNQPTSVLIRTTGVGYATQPVLSAARANSGEAGVRSNVYFTFTVSADAGYELDLSSLAFNAARGGGSTPRDYDIRSSLDGFATSLTGIVPLPTQRPTFTPVSVDLSGALFQDLTSPLTFQFRFFTPGVSQNVDFDDITLNGTVALAIPEPNTLAALATVGGWIWMSRRRRGQV